MLVYKIQKYLSDNSINFNKSIEFIKIESDYNGERITFWDEINIGIEQPSLDILNNISNETADLEESKNSKLQQLDNYHFNSSEIREMKVNDYFILSLSGEGRALIVEQIQTLEQQIKLNVITEESATFEYLYNNESIEITLVQLRQLYVFMMNVVNTNYSIYQSHIQAIKNLSTIKKVEAYNFTSKYLKNKKLNLS